MTTYKKGFYFPILALLSWNFFTIIVFAFGPYDYEIKKPFLFYTYLFGISLFLFLGYLRGQKSNGRNLHSLINKNKFVKFSIIISISYLIFSNLFNPSNNILNIFQTFNDSSESYSLRSTNQSPGIFTYLNMFVQPFNIISITNCLFFRRKLSKAYRYSGYLLILATAGSAIGAATRSGLVQVSLILFCVFLLLIYKKQLILNFKNKVIIFFTIMSAIIFFLFYSFILTTTRSGNIIINNPITQEPPNSDFFIDKITPDYIHPLTYNISFYLSHSYYRLNQAMQLPFKGLGFGLSNSVFVMNNIEKITGSSWLKEISYAIRIDKKTEYGDVGLYWSTFYCWIASDFTFLGVLMIMYFLGYFLSLSFRDSINFDNPLAIASFCILFYFIFYSVWGNPMQDGQGLITSLFLPLSWFILRKKI